MKKTDLLQYKFESEQEFKETMALIYDGQEESLKPFYGLVKLPNLQIQPPVLDLNRNEIQEAIMEEGFHVDVIWWRSEPKEFKKYRIFPHHPKHKIA